MVNLTDDADANLTAEAVHEASGTFLATTGPTGHLDPNAGDVNTQLNGDLNENDMIAVGTKGTMLFFYLNGEEDDADTKTVDESKQFLRRTGTTNNSDGTTTYAYEPVNVVSGIKIPVAAEFQHMHYGLWNSLTPATKTSSDKVADLGIGFVTAIADGDGMTDADDMPQLGDATYSGNWVANIQAADGGGKGLIKRNSGDAIIDANFAKGEVDVDLNGLAELTGTIAGNGFSGTKAAVHAKPVGRLGTSTEPGTFTGSFNGGFFGADATEAGGVFDFGSKGSKQGAFVGSFGGGQTADESID